MIPTLFGVVQTPNVGAPRWQYVRETPQTINEGDDITITLKGTNLLVGSRIIIWMTERMANAGSFNYDWTQLCRDAAASVGFDFTQLNFNTVPRGDTAYYFMFTVNANYKPGNIMRVTNSVKKNRSDDQVITLGDGTKGRQLQILIKTIDTAQGGVPATDGTIQPGSGSYIYVRDTSRKPTGYPTIQSTPFAGDGVSAPAGSLVEGDYFVYKFVTINPTPGTILKIYPANLAQNRITPLLRQELARAGRAANCIVTIPNYLDNPSAWFNGGYLQYTADYVDTNPVVMRFQVAIDDIAQETQEWDLIVQVYKEGDLSEFATYSNEGNWNNTKTYSRGMFVFYVPTGRYFVYFNNSPSSGNSPPTDGTTYGTDYWREFLPVSMQSFGPTKFFQDIPPRFWEIRAKTNGTTITYNLTVPTKFVGDSVTLSSINPPPGFDAALTQACGDGSIATYANGVITTFNTDRNKCVLTFTVPHAGSGKHALRLLNPQSGSGGKPAYLSVEEACVFLTAPVLPPRPANLYGLNASGAEFGNVFVQYYKPEEASKWANAPIASRMPYNGGRWYFADKPERPATAHQVLDYYWSKGARLLRFPVRWERIQPVLFGPLDYGPDIPFNETDGLPMRRIKEQIEYWISLGGYVLLDIHNFNSYTISASYDPTTQTVSQVGDVVGFASSLVPTAAFIDVCVKVAQFLEPYQQRVAFDLMNEPTYQGSVNARYIANQHQAAVAAIRARTNYLGKIHTEGGEYTSAANFVSNGNADAYSDFVDPAGNHTIHVHLYNNSDGSGAGADAGVCVSGSGKDKLGPITAWARQNGRKLHMGETGGGNPNITANALCGSIVPQLYQYMIDNKDVWEGFTAWGGGFPVSYAFCLLPSNNDYTNPVDGPSMQMLAPFLALTAPTATV